MQESAPRRFRVLIVDDDAVSRAVAAAALRSPRIELHEAKNGVEAASRARALQPDVMLLDVLLPVMDGLSVFRTLRQDPRCAGCHFVIVSGHTVEGALAMARDLGAFATLKKPAKPMQLRRVVFSALGLFLGADCEGQPLFEHLTADQSAPDQRSSRP